MKTVFLNGIVLVLAAVSCISKCPAAAGAAPAAAQRPKPTSRQLAWQEAEVGVLFSLDPRIYNVPMPGMRDVELVRDVCDKPMKDAAGYANRFNPAQLDTDQWIVTSKAMGARFAILVVTHETGFRLWQSDANPYCLKSIVWRGGKGDILRDFVNSCRKYDIKPGVFMSARWNAQLGVAKGKVGAQTPLTQTQYNKLIEREATELCTRYGDLFEIWFDGGVISTSGGGPNVMPIIKKHQPQAIIYPNGHDHRWAGSESGTVAYPCWATIAPGSHTTRKLFGTGDPNGSVWSPAMADVSLRHCWFWRSNTERFIVPFKDLQEKYYHSVGRNATLVVGLAPDPSGLIPSPDAARCKELGDWIRATFGGKPLAEASGPGSELTLELPATVKSSVTHIVLQEDIKDGERVRQYAVEADFGGTWKQIAAGSCIGHKRIERIAPCEARKFRLRVTQSTAEPKIRSFNIR